MCLDRAEWVSGLSPTVCRMGCGLCVLGSVEGGVQSCLNPCLAISQECFLAQTVPEDLCAVSFLSLFSAFPPAVMSGGPNRIYHISPAGSGNPKAISPRQGGNAHGENPNPGTHHQPSSVRAASLCPGHPGRRGAALTSSRILGPGTRHPAATPASFLVHS